MRIKSTSPEMTQRIAGELAELVGAGDVIALIGPLGAGKTCFAQGLAHRLGIREVVASPSFVLAKYYHASPGFLHVDAYRLSSAEELWQLGLEEQMRESVTVVEWADKVADALPEDRVELHLQYADGDCRTIEVRGCGERFEGVVSDLACRLSEQLPEPLP